MLVDEVTGAYERLHATVSLAILHQAADEFRFVVPAGFEVTEVDSPLLARWAVEKEPGRQVLAVRLREPTVQTVVLHLSASRTPPPLEKWTMPRLEPLDVVGQMAVVGLLVEDRLSAESIAATGLVGIDTSVLIQAIPPSVLRERAADAARGAPRDPARGGLLRPAGRLRAFGPIHQAARRDRRGDQRPPDRRRPRAQRPGALRAHAEGGEALRARLLGPCRLARHQRHRRRPQGGTGLRAIRCGEGAAGKGDRRLGDRHLGDSEPGKGDRHLGDSEPVPHRPAGRIRVRLPQGVAPGQSCRVRFEAEGHPTGWLAEGETETTPPTTCHLPPTPSRTIVPLPVFAVAGATRDVGAVAIDVRGDFTVQPETIKQLTPLDEKEKQSYGLGDVATKLAYRYESQPYQAAFSVERARPRLTAAPSRSSASSPTS